MLIDDSVYVAGHSGLIGSAVLRKLQKEKYNNIHFKSHSEIDLTKRDCVEDFFDEIKPKYVFLAAGKVGGIIENDEYPADFIISNLLIQTNIMMASQRLNVQKLIFFASSCMYPKNCKQPMDESMLLTGKPESTSIAYAISKLAGMQSCLSYNKQYSKVKFLPLIPNSVYGPNDNFDPNSSHVLSALIGKFYNAKIKKSSSIELWGTGEPRREFIHADDVADASLFLIKQKNLNQLPVNIGVGEDYSIKQLAKIIASEIGYEGKIIWDSSKPDGAPRKLLNSSYLNDLGWKPKIELKKGIKNTFNWFQESIN